MEVVMIIIAWLEFGQQLIAVEIPITVYRQ
jgi:hypothetical protein